MALGCMCKCTKSTWRLTDQAGICILRETGGYVSGGAEAFSRRADDAEVLMGRRIVAVRAVAKTEVRLASSMGLAVAAADRTGGIGTGDTRTNRDAPL